MTPRIPEVSAQQAARQVEAGEVLLLDVREDDEWESGHAPRARHVPLGTMRPADVPADRPIVAVCRSGNRSSRAAQLLSAAGLDVRNLEGGMSAWAAAGLPVVRSDGAPGQVA